MDNKILLAEQTFETLMKSVIIYNTRRIHYALSTPYRFPWSDDWLKGGRNIRSIESVDSSLLGKHYEYLCRDLKIAKYYKLHKRIKYYNRVLLKIKRELDYRKDLWENDRITYIEKYGDLK